MVNMFMSSSLICFLLSQLFIFQLVYCYCPKQFQCGSTTLSFPFSKIDEPNCGLFLVDCFSYPVIQVQPGGNWIIFNLNNYTTWIVPSLSGVKDCNVFNNITLPKNNSAISFCPSYPNVTMLKCDISSGSQSSDDLAGYRKFSQCENEHRFSIYYNYSGGLIVDPVGNDYPSGCSTIQWPIGNRTFDPQSEEQLFYLLDIGFPIDWNLNGSCKECYLNNTSEDDGCIVNPENFTCFIGADSEEGNRNIGLIVGPAVGVITIFAIIAYCLGKDYLANRSFFWGAKKYENIETFLKNRGALGLERYSYSDIKKMTNSFQHKIGQGGFGSVYKGCSKDGCPVAVKLSNDSKGNGEDFINEVASISKTSHVNIVKLLGFCFQGNTRALVYEFMAKGSLEKFIFSVKSSPSSDKLEMQTLFKIAIGIARGLEYLHRLCAMKIVHLDVKPHNVLLDEDFTPKISDFGLAKSCLREQNSTVTLSCARGTIGYIAPEVVCRYLGSVSHKSDVYSYGMMVLEIVGGRRNVDNAVDNSSQIYMPHWIYNQIKTNQDFDFLAIGNNEDEELARKMIIVSFWCIQTDPSSRPTMTRVVEMLESKVEVLQIPPRPYLFSTPNSPINQRTLHPEVETEEGEFRKGSDLESSRI